MRLLIVALLLVLALPAQAQVTRWYTSADTVNLTTAWQSFTVTGNQYAGISGFSVDNDGLVSLYVAVNNDTSAGYRVLLRSGEGLIWNGLTVNKIWAKAITGTCTARIRYW